MEKCREKVPYTKYFCLNTKHINKHHKLLIFSIYFIFKVL